MAKRDFYYVPIGSFFVSTSFLLAGCISTVAHTPQWLQRQIEQARTSEEHREIAQYYEGQAAALIEKAKEHERRAYSYGPLTDYARLQNDLSRHCTYIAALYRQGAEASLKLAKRHL